MPRHRYCCLIGNGLSIAYNPDLRIPPLTEALLAQFRALGGEEAATGLKTFAERLTGSSRETFEELLSPLEYVSRSLVGLTHLLPLASGGGNEDAVSETVDLLQGVHRVGLGIVLSLLDERARGRGPAFEATIVKVCRALQELRGNSHKPVSVATLNYDGLLHAGFMELTPSDGWGLGTPIFCDLSAGYSRGHHSPYGDEVAFSCLELRESPNLMDRPIQLINLHGYLGWLWDPATDRLWKFELDDLRGEGSNPNYWARVREGHVAMHPLVVLTDRKTEAVSDPPFALAYDLFGRALFQSDRWLIAGHSFGDKPVLRAFQEGVIDRRRKRESSGGFGWEDPTILVVDLCSDEEGQRLRARVTDVLELPEDRVTISCQGLPNAVESQEWASWMDGDHG